MFKRIAAVWGWQVPGVVGLGVDATLAALGCIAGVYFGPDLAKLLGPHDWPETFQASLVDGEFIVQKTRTDADGYAEIWFCQRNGDGATTMALVHTGIFSEREETIRLAAGENDPLLRDRPVVILTNLVLEDETMSFLELMDPRMGTRMNRAGPADGQHDCSWDAVRNLI